MRNAVFFLLLAIVVLTGCKKTGCTNPAASNYDSNAVKDDGSCKDEVIVVESDPEPELHAGYITDTTWTCDRIHVLSGKVVVQSGSTLTIEPGTIIKGKEGIGTLTSALVVEPGAQIHAEGTSTSPIIFTSFLDNIEIGQQSGTNLTENDKGLWGGVIILGHAPISAADGDVLTQIQGIPLSGFFYGGNDTFDDSGVFRYVSIRHTGSLIGAGNQCNGLMLGGVGSGTVVDHVEVVAGLDDGIQIFGGTVNVSNVVVGYPGDDGIETEMNFDGTISNAAIILNNDSDKAIEMKGPEGQTYVDGVAELSDISVLSDQANLIQSQFRKEVKATISNVNFNGDVLFSASYESDCLTPLPDALNNLIGSNPLLVFNNCSRDALQINSVACAVPPADQSAAEAAFSIGTPIGADISEFTSWTWLSLNGKL